MLKLTGIGNLGRDAEVKAVGGKNVINFSFAHTEKFKDQSGNQKEKTTWVSCAYWTDKTGIVPYLKKGAQVYVEGTPEVRTYPKNDGTTGTELYVRVTSIQLLGSKEGTSNGAAASASAIPKGKVSADTIQNNDDSDDLPF
jgi:single-strand DNA-binding protein